MRIGIDARFLGPKGKGLGRYTQKLIEGLEKIDHQNQYVIFLRRENWDDYHSVSSNFKKVLADYRWYSFAEQIFLPFKIYQQKIGLMHFPHFNVPVFYFGRFVVTVHDLILRHFKTRRASVLGPIGYWIKNAVYRMVIWLAVKRAQKIIAVSNYVKKDIIAAFGVAEDKVTLTYEGAPDKSFRFQVSGFRSDYKIKKPYLLYVGNAYPHKNLERLIKAFEILAKKYNHDVQLVLVGEDDYFYRRLKQEAKTSILASMEVLQRIVFAGFVNDEGLERLYDGATLYVFPSLCEGFGLPPLEAMARGLPVVSSDKTCLPEILGDAAFYFNALNPESMAEKVDQVLSDNNLREWLISAGFGQIKKYSWQKMAEETLRIFRDAGGE
ncbi:MAG: glycosyltransferase family 1 protein [bacterium]